MVGDIRQSLEKMTSQTGHVETHCGRINAEPKQITGKFQPKVRDYMKLEKDPNNAK